MIKQKKILEPGHENPCSNIKKIKSNALVELGSWKREDGGWKLLLGIHLNSFHKKLLKPTAILALG